MTAAAASHDLLLRDTLGVALQDGLVGLIRVLHGDGLGEFSQHPLLEGLQPFVVVASTDELFVLVAKHKKTKKKTKNKKLVLIPNI